MRLWNCLASAAGLLQALSRLLHAHSVPLARKDPGPFAGRVGHLDVVNYLHTFLCHWFFGSLKEGTRHIYYDWHNLKGLPGVSSME